MGTRFLIFHGKTKVGNDTYLGSAYYLEADYTPVAVRLYAVNAPRNDDAEVDILKDGTSIIENRSLISRNIITGVVTTPTAVTTVFLPDGENSEVNGADFSTNTDGETVILEKGSWITCKQIDSGNSENLTVQLEIYSGAEEQTEE